ncbi:NAD(P)-dependent dehydrogenase, short-chain alcohol dehydrogenase family [Lutibacter agarilyticus]|uniref:NAD(P)-dependent dehydrogenase, short-chain alcohol dehydrogenase family n=1 Tax=Lutibacter agarilyticus TaxID=1109740 RepID=A0A238YRL9_9FLAO|nr:SDR family oxidoreductase [Lutibacter agarilyticus]SNR73458.1 NAD(P)-dependent dehydrogenase, short-chain alcohol dehydrogenase family [Lutibacter agarilyticus]
MKTIVIIGGSKGIGKAISQLELTNNKVINISRSDPEFYHQNLTHYNCDILIDELPDLETIDTLIYCPGSINLKPFNRLNLEDFKNDYEINFLGAVKAIQKYLPLLKESAKPSVLLFSTVASKLGMPFHASIASAKAAVEGLVKSLAAEFSPTIRVNAIAPTVTNTTLASKLLRNDRLKDQMIERHPLKKYLQPEEIAEMASFLISEKAGSMSGQIIEMDCGITTIKS